MAATATKKMDVRVSNTEEDVAQNLAGYVAKLSQKFAEEKKKFTVVLSGGTLIQTLRKLIEEPYLHSVDWSAWHVFWLDERRVPKTDNDNNYKLAYDGFLSKVPIPPSNIYPVNTQLAEDEAAADYESRIKHLIKNKTVDCSKATGFPEFDLMLLGMGTDGHVASLFPGSPLLHEKKMWVVASTAPPRVVSPERITMTFPVINSAANVALVITGSNNPPSAWDALAENVAKGVKGGGEGKDLLPVQMVKPIGPLTWFLDNITAAKL